MQNGSVMGISKNYIQNGRQNSLFLEKYLPLQRHNARFLANSCKKGHDMKAEYFSDQYRPKFVQKISNNLGAVGTFMNACSS